MASGFSGLGLGELGAESKYIGKANTYYQPAVVKNAKGEPQYDLLGRIFNGLEDTTSKYLGDKLAPAVNWLENKFSPAVPPSNVPMPVSPVTGSIGAAPAVVPSAVAVPAATDADHHLVEGTMLTDPPLQ